MNKTKAQLQRERRINGGGPWLFTPENDLDPGESFQLDLRNMTYNGAKGWFRKWLPLDSVTVTNLDPSNGLKLVVNNQFESFVVPSAVEGFDGAGITHVAVENQGGTTVSADDVKIELLKEPYNSDQKARDEIDRPWLERALDEAIPGGLPSFNFNGGGGRGR